MVFPNYAAKNAGGSLAFFVLQNGQTDIIKIKPIKGRYFICQYGLFLMDIARRYQYGKSNMYFYHTKIGFPLDIESLAKIKHFLERINEPNLKESDVQLDKVRLEKDDIIATSFREMVGQQTLQFLEDMTSIDEESIQHALNEPFRTDKKPPQSNKLKAFPPSKSPQHIALYISKEKRVEKVNLKVKRQKQIDKDETKIIGQCKFGKFDLSEKQNRYYHGKSSLYILLEDQEKPVDMNVYSYLSDFANYEPVALQDLVDQIRHTKRTYDYATKAVAKKPMNIMLIIVGIVGFVLLYNMIINPALNEMRTDQNIKDAQEKNRIAAEMQAKQNSTNTTKMVISNQTVLEKQIPSTTIVKPIQEKAQSVITQK